MKCLPNCAIRSKILTLAASLTVLCLLAGCASSPPHRSAGERRFDFARDTFAFPNQLVWHYGYDEKGQWKTSRREESPEYTLHCFVLARSAAQFFEHARFEPELPRADEKTYRRLIRKVVSRSLRSPPKDEDRIIIPGFCSLREFSQVYEQLLKSECGGYWQSYFQRGNWRMIFPFSRGQQATTVKHLTSVLTEDRIAVVHLVRFPKLTINHAVVVFQVQQANDKLLFLSYDPNDPDKPLSITYENSSRTFLLPSTDYFPGGRVDVYQVYHRWNY